MNCLLVASTAKEIAPFINHCRIGGNRAGMDILITGIGLTATTYSLVKQVCLKKPGIIIQAGIAGSYDKNISPGSVVVVKQDAIADLSVMENKELKTMFDLGLAKPGQFPFRNGWLVNLHDDLLRQTKLKRVRGISVNHITTSKQMIALYQNKFRPSVESMEGAALHYVALMEKIPFLQVRSISNYTGERNKKKWKIKEAVINLNEEIINISSKF